MDKIKFYLKKIVKGLFIFLARITNSNLISFGYYQKGICKSGSDFFSGEKFVIEKVIPKYIKNNNPVFFDVGSNEGEYSFNLKKIYPNSNIFAFEANPETYKKIPEKIKRTSINFINIGLSSSIGTDSLYDYKNNTGSQHASMYEGVFSDRFSKNDYVEINFKKDTVDNFCFKNKIEKINFLKIDTEGSEFDVLSGAKNMIDNDNIDLIQFEFNEMNVISRVFLRDYYLILKNYDIYRIDSKKLIHLPKYDTENEIFKYQNFLAINKKLDKK